MEKTLIVFPLKKELQHFVSAIKAMGLDVKNHSLQRLNYFSVQDRPVILAVGGHGKVQFAVQTQYLLHHFSDREAVLCVGSAGGLSESVAVGDVILANKTIEHDYKERFDPAAALPEVHAHQDLLKKFSELKPSFDFRIHLGPIASGDEDIVDPERANNLLQQTKALAVAWEGAGGARACRFNQIPFLEIRSISDNARHSVADSFSKNLERCMRNAADVIIRGIA